MKTIYFNRQHTRRTEPAVATLGFFDGVHLGHQHLIAQVVDEAQRTGMTSMVITFDLHPRQVLRSDFRPELLSTFENKLKLIAQTGVDCVVVLHFDEMLSHLSAHDFMRDILFDRLGVHRFVIGYDNHFGHNRTEGFPDYVRYGQEMGMEVLRATPFALDGVEVSSSLIRGLIKEGELLRANTCLGHDYLLTGQVVHGYKQGRQMGYPTANLDIARSGQLVPACGVYATMVRVPGIADPMPAMTSVGMRPTFGAFKRTIETYILDFEADLYDRVIDLMFVCPMRPEQKFDSVDLLIEQLKEDERQVRSYFKQRISL